MQENRLGQPSAKAVGKHNVSTTASTTPLSVQQPILPKGGGAIQGIGEQFTADEFTGVAHLSLPIPVTPCRAITPALSLNYSSGSGNSPYGLGWSVNTPTIARKTNQGIPRYLDLASDLFLFNGDDLVLLDHQPGETRLLNNITYTIVLYCPRKQANFPVIEYWQPIEAAEQAAAFWQVISADHQVSIFGYHPQARISDPREPSHIFAWLLEETYNACGDHQLLFYQEENTDNVPALYTKGHESRANRYLHAIRYGCDRALSESMVLSADPAVDDPSVWHFEVVFDYGEYDTQPSNHDPYLPVKAWDCRPDPFSTYAAGFEVRSYRRVCHTLLFHRFPELSTVPVLVKVMAYRYESASLTLLSELTSVQLIGYQYQSDTQPYLTRAMPSLQVSYSDFQPTAQFFTTLQQFDGNYLTGFDQPPYYQFVDLYGEGIPGIVYADGQSVYYQQAVLSPAHTEKLTQVPALSIPAPAKQKQVAYSQPLRCTNFPIVRRTQGEGVTLADLTGDGLLDIVVSSSSFSGFYPAQNSNTWGHFQPFLSFPADYAEPYQASVDLVGDGMADLVQVNETAVRVYPALGKEGFGQSWSTLHAADFPVILDKTQQKWVTFADMAGSGTPSLVQIESNKITYWPSVGYGEFAAPITLGNVPDFGCDFDTSRLFLVDIDGSGTTDLVYVEYDKAVLYLNQSGNTLSAPIAITLPFTYDQLDQISFADVYGCGTLCLVISVLHDTLNPTYWCYDFCQQRKPYLLQTIDNNLGATTTIAYASSVDYYLADAAAGIPWATKLPFPVQVVANVTAIDRLSQTTTVNYYAYHDGYYDGNERAFQGFGQVDRQDTETILDFSSEAASYQSPPTLTKTWYQIGHGEQAKLTLQYQQSYWHGDSQAYAMPPTQFIYQPQITPADVAQADVAFSGSMLRQEIYGLDGSQWQGNPYSVQENRWAVTELQAKGDQRYAVFLTYLLESMAYQYERNSTDPKCQQSVVLAVDAYGHVLQSCQIAYGRRALPATQTQLYTPAAQTNHQQQTTILVYTEQTYINKTSTSDYLLGVEQDMQQYEIMGLTPAQGLYFSREQLIADLSQGIDALPPLTQAKRLAWQRAYYFDPTQQVELPSGEVTVEKLMCRSASVQCLLETLPQALETAMADPVNGYQYDSKNQCYWNPGNFQAYLPEAHFCLPAYFCDALHYRDWQLPVAARVATVYFYDPYDLLIYQAVDPLGNTQTSPLDKIDYQVMAATQLIDANGNSAEVMFDPLGQVIVTSVYGTEGGQYVGFAPLSEYKLPIDVNLSSIIANPSAYLQQAASFFYYDMLSWQAQGIPVSVLQLKACDYSNPRTQPAQTTGYALSMAYYDGFGRLLQSKTQVNQQETTARSWNATQQQINQPTTNSVWVTSGAVQYSNKGQPIKQYEPFFSDSYAYIDEAQLNSVGVSDTLYYDPLGRPVLTITALGYLSKQLFGYLQSGTTADVGGYLAQELYADLPGEFYPSPWNSLSFDTIDAIKQSPYYQAAAVDEKARLDQLPYNTPILTYQDTAGQMVQSGQLLVDTVDTNETYHECNSQGQVLTQADARLFAKGIKNIQTVYDLTGQVLEQVSVDAGTTWSLNNVVGKPCYQVNARQCCWRYNYDVLQRPLSITVSDGACATSITTEVFIYGESFSDPDTWNLRGQVVAHFDQAGLVLSPFFTIAAEPLAGSRALCEDYKQTPNWQAITADTEAMLIAAVEQLDWPRQLQAIDLSYINGLEPTAYATYNDYNAGGFVIESVDPDGNITRPLYYPSGLLQSSAIDNGPSVTSIRYNAKGQRTKVVYGNQITTAYTYEEKTFRLRNLKSVYTPTNATLQDHTYDYDPMDNITAIARNDAATVYFDNQAVAATSHYSYDALYRLIAAEGREHTNSSASHDHQEKFFSLTQPLTNGAALQNYTENYQYDAGNNLLSIQHTAAAYNTSWQRSFSISDTNNRLIQTSESDTATYYHYDAAGNMQDLSNVRALQWNERNNIQSAVIIARDNGNDDAEYYMYDSQGQRVRKVHEQQTASGTTVTDCIYLGNFEIRRTFLQSADSIKEQENWRVIRFMDDQNCVAVWRYALEDGQRATTADKNQQRYQLLNQLKSSVMEVSVEGEIITYEEYYPYGGTAYIEAATLTDAQSKYYRYSFKEQDEVTGLYYYGMRYYPPWLGRWLNPDPAGTVDGLNLYAFVGGNPVTQFDVGGLGACSSRPRENQREQRAEQENTAFSENRVVFLPFNERGMAAAGEIQNIFPGSGRWNDDRMFPNDDYIREERAIEHIARLNVVDFRVGPNPTPGYNISIKLDGNPGTIVFQRQPVGGEQVRFLPAVENHLSTFSLGADAATNLFTAKLTGCTFAVAHNNNTGTTLFHALFRAANMEGHYAEIVQSQNNALLPPADFLNSIVIRNGMQQPNNMRYNDLVQGDSIRLPDQHNNQLSGYLQFYSIVRQAQNLGYGHDQLHIFTPEYYSAGNGGTFALAYGRAAGNQIGFEMDMNINGRRSFIDTGVRIPRGRGN